MNNKITLAGVAILAAFALGRYTAKAPVVTGKETVVQTQVKDTETKKTTTIVKSPTGEVKTIITEDTTSKTKTDRTAVTATAVKPETSLNVSLLVGTNYHEITLPIYGIMVSKRVLGPASLGAWGLNNGTVGVSLGLEF